MKKDRRLTLHVLEDGRIDAVVTIPYLDIAVSRHRFMSGWKHVLELIARATKEWDKDNKTNEIIITFETKE